MKNTKLLTGIIIALCCALAVSLYFNFKSPYLPDNKAEHLGQLTYTLPIDCKWVYGDFEGSTTNPFPGKDGTYAVEGKTGKVLEKGYVDMDTLAELSVGYNVLDQKVDSKDEVSWSGEHGDIPDCVKDLTIGTDETEEAMGTYWRATFNVDGVAYVVNVYGSAIKSGDWVYIGEELVQSIGVDPSLKDEYSDEYSE